MGGQQSTRRLTVVNDEAVGVIKITDSVEERIRNEILQNKAMQSVHGREAPPPPPEPKPEVPPEPEVKPVAPPPPPPPSQPAPPQQEQPPQPPQQQQQKPIIQYVEREPTMTSLRVKAEKEKELTEAEAYWRKRFAKQEREHTTLAHLEVATMNETAERLKKSFTMQRSPPICQQERDFVLQCYKQNPDKPLLCSEVVKDFSRCVHSARMTSG